MSSKTWYIIFSHDQVARGVDGCCSCPDCIFLFYRLCLLQATEKLRTALLQNYLRSGVAKMNKRNKDLKPITIKMFLS